MKTYSVLFAQDVPHYGSVEIQAESDTAALEAAKAYDLTEVTDAPDWENTVCKRIVHMELCEDVLSELARTDDGTPSISALNMIRDILAKAERRA